MDIYICIYIYIYAYIFKQIPTLVLLEYMVKRNT